MRKTILSLLTLTLLLALAVPGWAAYTAMDFFTGAAGGYNQLDSSDLKGSAQAFKGSGNAITRIRIYGYKEASPSGYFTVMVTSGIGTWPNITPNESDVKWSNTYDPTTLATSPGWFDIFPTPISNTNNQELCVAIKYGAAPNGTTIDMKVGYAIDFSNGGGHRSEFDGSTWTTALGVLVFEIDSGSIAVAPTVTTQNASAVGPTTATGNGTITDNGGATTTEVGCCVSTTNANPTKSDTSFTGSTVQSGVFTASMTGLTLGLTYHYSTYAINSAGTTYTTGNDFVTVAANQFTDAGGNHLCSNTANWSLGHVATPYEKVIISPTVTSLIIDGTYQDFGSLDATGCTGITISGSSAWYIEGNFTLDSNVTWGYTGALYLVGTQTVNTGGLSLNGTGSVHISSTSNVTLGYALNLGSTPLQIYGTGGSFATGNFALTCGTLGQGAGTGSPTISFGSSTINCATVDFSSSTPTISASGATINCSAPSGDFKLNLSSGTATVKFPQVTSTVSSFSAHGLTLTSASGGTATLSDSAGSNDVTNCTLSHLAATGGATWNAFTSAGNTDGGSNSGWTFSGGYAPTVTCQSASSLAKTTATLNGNVTVNGGTISAYGFYISATNNPPTSADTVVTGSGIPGATGAFTGAATGLTAGTTYHCVAFATNEYGGPSTSANHDFVTARDPGTFYVAVGGSVTDPANISVATGVSYPTNYMNVACHNTATFVPGDTIRLSDKGGAYTISGTDFYCIKAPSSGSDGPGSPSSLSGNTPITYTNVPGETPTIDASFTDDGSGWTDIGGGQYRKQFNDRDWIDMLRDNGTVKKAASSEALTDGDWRYYGAHYVVINFNPSGHTLRMTWLASQYKPYGIDLRNQSNIDVSGITFNYCGIGHGSDAALTAPPSPLKNLRIYNNIINYAWWGVWSDLKDDVVEQDVEVYKNTLYYCNGGITTYTDAVPVAGQQCHPLRHNYHDNKMYHLYSMDGTHNYTWASNTNATYSGFDHEGVSFQDAVDCIVSDNYIHNDSLLNVPEYNRGIFIFLCGESAIPTTGNKIIRNFITGIYTQGIYIEWGLATAGFQNNTIADNILYETDTDGTQYVSGICFYAGMLNPLSGANYILNNTIYHTNSGSCLWFIGGSDARNLVIENNIIRGGNLLVEIGGSSYSGSFTFNYNCYDPKAGVTEPFGYAGSMTFTTWTTTGPNGHPCDTTGSFVADPRFAGGSFALATNFKLQSSSPCKAAGTMTPLTTTGITTDYEGASWGSPPAMGAYAQPVIPYLSTQGFEWFNHHHKKHVH